MKGDSSIPGAPNPPKRRFRSAPKVWQDIIKSIVNESYDGEGITYDAIASAVIDEGYSISRDALRVKMARYVKTGYVKPVTDPMTKKRVRGAFWLTQSGRLFFNLESRRKQKTTMLPTSSSPWDLKFPKIDPAADTAK